MPAKTALAGLFTGAILCCTGFNAYADWDISGSGALEHRVFWQDALYPNVPDQQLSAFAEVELFTEWNDGRDSLTIKPFARWDKEDSERTHLDLREFMWLRYGDDWELKAGVGRVFWGQVESQHLVDVINQIDLVEAIDGEDRLGQPMVNFSLIKDWGTTSFFVLPYFRERTFPGLEGRLRLPFRVDVDNPLYESGAEEHHVDWAVRWSHSIGDWEVGLAHFDGTSRDPNLLPSVNETGEVVLRPFYPQMRQTSVDLLAVLDAWLLKFEGFYRDTEAQDFVALTGGLEYTFVGVFDTAYDLGWLLEYQYDERDEATPTPGQNDLMTGARFVVNDVAGTEVLLAWVQDLDSTSSYSAFVEASARINDNWKWRVDAWLFSSDEPQDTVFLLRRDDYVQFSLEYYF